jgi:S-(hydroxymethyl)glutathione dehydrogenase/alcohol dehydrogenase
MNRYGVTNEPRAAGSPLEIMKVDLERPRECEVLVEITATGIGHTDAFTLSGPIPKGSILGDGGVGVVVDVGSGVASVRKGGRVSRTTRRMPASGPPACPEIPCTAIRSMQGKGVMPDGTSRFPIRGEKLHHHMGCPTVSNFTCCRRSRSPRRTRPNASAACQPVL